MAAAQIAAIQRMPELNQFNPFYPSKFEASTLDLFYNLKNRQASNINFIKISTDVFFQQIQQQLSPNTTPDRTSSPSVKAPTNVDLPSPSPTTQSGEQPLDLSAKPGGSSMDSKNIFKWVRIYDRQEFDAKLLLATICTKTVS